jgi:signal transduction histidine kinase
MFSNVLFWIKRRDVSSRWMAVFFFTLCLKLLFQPTSHRIIAVDVHHSHILFFLGFYGMAYAVVMFALYYTRFASSALRRWLGLALFVPLPMIALYINHQPEQLDGIWLYTCFNLPYIAFAAGLLARDYVREINFYRKRSTGTVSVIMILPLAVFTVFFYLQSEWAYNATAIFGLLTLFLLAYLYGAFGLRIMLVQQIRSQSLESIASGTAIFNHFLKNRLTNIDLLTEQLFNVVDKQSNDDLVGQLLKVKQENERMFDLIKRVQAVMEEIRIRPAKIKLIVLFGELLHEEKEILHNHSVKVTTACSIVSPVYADPYHFKEALRHLLRNAVEAITKADGTINLKAYISGKNISFHIRDNGEGMNRNQLKRAFEPFYSTKSPGNHEGLGLSYSYLVMRMHGGSIDIFSNLGRGTEVILTLPMRV